LHKEFKELKRGHKVLEKELDVKREEIAVEQKKCEDVQMLKFGQIIDLSILAKVFPSFKLYVYALCSGNVRRDSLRVFLSGWGG